MNVFEAGAACHEITPPPGVPLWGYKDRTGPATGTLDPLYVKVCVCRAGGSAVAFVVFDLGRVPLPPVLDRIREASRGAGVDGVFFSAMHTHHGPVMEMETAAHIDAIEAATIAAVKEAAACVRPVRVGIETVELDIAHNRRELRADGRCYMRRRNEHKRPTAPVDREATVVAFVDDKEKLVASMVHFACHPVILGPPNRLYSADYVGELTRLVEEQTSAPCLFLQGACGDVNPYLAKTLDMEAGVRDMRAVGAACANRVMEALASVTPQAASSPAVGFVETQVLVGARWNPDDAREMELLRAAHGRMFDIYVRGVTAGLRVPLVVVLLNGEIGFVGMPGEMFVQHQLALKTGAPVKYALLCGYTNGYYGYFPTVKDAAAGGYGGTCASFVGIGAADRMLVEAEIGLGVLAGAFGRPTEADDFEVLDVEED